MLAMEGPHELARGGEDHRARREASAAIHRQVRQHLFLGMVLGEDLALPERRAEDVRRRLFLGRTRRLDSVRARRRDATRGAIKRGVCAAGHKALYCDEWGGLPDKEFLARSTRISPICATGSTKRPTTPPSRRARFARSGRASSACQRASRSRSANSTFTTARSAAASREGTLVKVIGTSTCDCGVVSAEKARRRHSGHLRHRQGRDPARLLRHRGRPVGGRRHLQVVGRGRLRRRRRAARATHRGGREADSRARPACSRSTGTTATAPSSSTSCSPACCSARTSTRRGPKSIAR